MSMFSRRQLLATSAVTLTLPPAVGAQALPAKQIRMIAPDPQMKRWADVIVKGNIKPS
jgi:hypothetical protein